jgi:hypothetical protein
VANIFTSESNFNDISRQDAKTAKVFLGELCAFAYRDVGEGREQDAEALREKILSFTPRLSET